MSIELQNNLDRYIKEKRYRLVNSVLVYKDNQLVFERYYNKFDENSRNNIKSIWKSILSICTGICIDKGYINSLEEPVYKYSGMGRKMPALVTPKAGMNTTGSLAVAPQNTRAHKAGNGFSGSEPRKPSHFSSAKYVIVRTIWLV